MPVYLLYIFFARVRKPFFIWRKNPNVGIIFCHSQLTIQIYGSRYDLWQKYYLSKLPNPKNQEQRGTISILDLYKYTAPNTNGITPYPSFLTSSNLSLNNLLKNFQFGNLTYLLLLVFSLQLKKYLFY
mgnify:CR=1 FL=1